MLKRLYALALLAILALSPFLGGGLYAPAFAQQWSADAAVSTMKDIEKDGEKVARQGVSTFRKWALIISGLAFIGFAIASAFGHFKLGWGTRWIAGTMGIAAASGIIFIFTGITMAF